MRSFAVLALGFALGLVTTRVSAQDKAAEGTYEFHGVSYSGAPTVSPDTHWILYSRPAGGYRLESEPANRPQGNRFLQIEELDERLIPISIAFKIFTENHKESAFQAACNVTNGITCSLQGGDEGPWANTHSYHYEGAFQLLIDNFGAVDLVWLLAGAINMARTEGANTKIATIFFTDSSTSQHEIEFKIDDKKPLNFVGSETMKFNGKNLAVRHYIYGSGKHVWVTESGILIKISYGTDEDLWVNESGIQVKKSMQSKDQDVLSDYRQYKKLIPELGVETEKTNSPR